MFQATANLHMKLKTQHSQSILGWRELEIVISLYVKVILRGKKIMGRKIGSN